MWWNAFMLVKSQAKTEKKNTEAQRNQIEFVALKGKYIYHMCLGTIISIKYFVPCLKFYTTGFFTNHSLIATGPVPCIGSSG